MISKDPSEENAPGRTPETGLPSALEAALSETLAPPPERFDASERVRIRLRERIAGSLAAGAASASTDAAQASAGSRSSAREPVSSASATPALADLITLRASTTGEGWVEMLPKAHAKLLFTDGVAESYMIRLEPGARAPAHEHPADEECLVLEGTLWQGDVFLKAGDFHVARPGMKHGELRTDTGALVFIRYGRPLAEYLRMP